MTTPGQLPFDSGCEVDRLLLEHFAPPATGDHRGAANRAEAETGRAVLALARQVRPDVVLMAISMPEMNGVEATHRLVAELPGIRVVGLSIHADHRYVTALMAAGAVACVSKRHGSRSR
jgi:DNA-binding NarL/FixJ family response regulator